VLKSIGLLPSLLSATDEIQHDRNRDIALTTRLSEPLTVTEEGLLTVLRKPDNLAYKNDDDHNVELDEQSQEELPISELLPEQNHKAIS